jgi:serine/threonine protein kinase
MPPISSSPPHTPQVKYPAQHGTRWQREQAAAGKGVLEYPDDPKRIGPWIVGECVGKGSCGRVRIAKHRATGQLAAVKILPLRYLVTSRSPSANRQAVSGMERLTVDREVVMMKLMDHPNIVRIYDVYEGEKELYLVLEYVEGGELFDLLVNRGKMPALEALEYFKQIVYGLSYAHTFSIIHRDLKPENILICTLDPPLIKIADWGMAAFAPPLAQLETFCGSPHYASPEIVSGMKYKGGATDIWSCGVILYILLTGGVPFDDEDFGNLLEKVKLGVYSIPDYVDPLAKDLIQRMLVVNVTQRITVRDSSVAFCPVTLNFFLKQIPQILNHPYFLIPTPSIPTPPPPPPVADLAKPLSSPAHIDSELFESLKIIWGRHATAGGKEILADLLSPAGEGILAKAFYFLLGAYRERTKWTLDDEADMESEQGKVITKHYSAKAFVRPNVGPVVPNAQPTRSKKSEKVRFSGQVAAPSRHLSTSLAVPAKTNFPFAIDQAPHSRSPSPVGPRSPHLIATDTISTPKATRYIPEPSLDKTPVNHYVHPAGMNRVPLEARDRDLDRTVFSPRMSYTPRHIIFSPQPAGSGPANPRDAFIPANYNRHTTICQNLAPPAPPRRSTLSTQSPRLAHPQVTLYSPTAHEHQPLQPSLPWFTSPKIDNAEIQRAIDDITERVNELNAKGNSRIQMLQQQNGNRYEHGQGWRPLGPREHRPLADENRHPGYTNIDGYPLPDLAVYIPPPQSDTPAPPMHTSREAGTGGTQHLARDANKENMDVSMGEQIQASSGLGMGFVGRDVRNTISNGDSTISTIRGVKGKKKNQGESVFLFRLLIIIFLIPL